jgi:hypothetical protein
MKAICKSCKFEVSGANNKELEDNFRGHSMTFGHLGFYIVDYD